MIERIQTGKAPEAIGPYSQAVAHGGLIYCSGQIALDPGSMEMTGDDAALQTEQVMKNLGALLEAAGSGFSRVLKCSIFLTDMADFRAVNDVYGRYFPAGPPARETIAVRALPKGALVEISAVAAIG